MLQIQPTATTQIRLLGDIERSAGQVFLTIPELAVHADAQQRGIGSALMQHAMAAATGLQLAFAAGA